MRGSCAVAPAKSGAPHPISRRWRIAGGIECLASLAWHDAVPSGTVPSGFAKDSRSRWHRGTAARGVGACPGRLRIDRTCHGTRSKARALTRRPPNGTANGRHCSNADHTVKGRRRVPVTRGSCSRARRLRRGSGKWGILLAATQPGGARPYSKTADRSMRERARRGYKTIPKIGDEIQAAHLRPGGAAGFVAGRDAYAAGEDGCARSTPGARRVRKFTNLSAD